MQQIDFNSVKTPNLSPRARAQFLMAVLNTLSGGVVVTVAITYDNQTDGKRRIAGEDFQAIPGVDPRVQLGTLSAHFRVDNQVNQRAGTVGELYVKVCSLTRGNGVRPYGYTALRPEGIEEFNVLGFIQVQQAPAEQAPAPVGA